MTITLPPLSTLGRNNAPPTPTHCLEHSTSLASMSEAASPRNTIGPPLPSSSAIPPPTVEAHSTRRCREVATGMLGIGSLGLLALSSTSFGASLVAGNAGDRVTSRAQFAVSTATGLFGVLAGVAAWLVASGHRRGRPTAVALASVGLLVGSTLLPHQPGLGLAAVGYLVAVIAVFAKGTTVISRRHPSLDRSPTNERETWEGDPSSATAPTPMTPAPITPTPMTYEVSRATRRRDVAGLIATIVMVLIALGVRPEAGIGLLIGAAIFVPLEKALPIRSKATRRAHWKTDAAHFLVNNLLTLAVLAVVLVAAYLLLGWAISPDLQAAVRQQPGWLQFVEAILVSQVAFYGAHRAAHRIPVLWRFHKVHHSPVELDWLAAARLHPVDLALGQAAVVIPLFAFGFSKETFGAYLVFSQFEAIFGHSNVRFRYGPLRWLIGGPLFHHWHHNDEPTARDVNFSGLPLIDWIFGTCYLPNRWPTRYGIGEPVPATYLRQLAWPFRGPT